LYIYASEVSSLCGYHPFQKRSLTFEKILERYNANLYLKIRQKLTEENKDYKNIEERRESVRTELNIPDYSQLKVSNNSEANEVKNTIKMEIDGKIQNNERKYNEK